MSLQEWLILIGVVVVIGTVVDGLRRMRLARRRASELSFGIEEVKGYDESFSSELPNGGARSSIDDPGSLTSMPSDSNSSGYSSIDDLSGYSDRIEPDLDDLNFGSALEPELDLFDPKGHGTALNEPPPEPAAANHIAEQRAKPEPLSPYNDKRIREARTEKTAAPEPSVAQTSAPKKADPVQEKPVQERKAQKKPVQGKKSQEKLSDRPAVEEVIVINVLAKSGEVFDGARLLQGLLNAGMRFGDRSIFHSYSKKDGSGQIQFSLANGEKPGTFNIEQMDSTMTTALSLFLCLPGPEAPVKAFTQMEEVAKQLALDLGGELKDENMSVMTQQTLEHCRQRIRDYERKQLAIKLSH